MGWEGVVELQGLWVRGERGLPLEPAVKMEPASAQPAEPLELKKGRETASHVPWLQKEYISHLALRKCPIPSGNSFTTQVPKAYNASNVPLISRILKFKRMTSFLFFELACLWICWFSCQKHYHTRPPFGFRDKLSIHICQFCLSLACFHHLLYPVHAASAPVFFFWNISFWI